jgi:fumarate reductase flavoprotein subunit
MAGLVAAARARELGLSPVVLEKGTRAGGSMLLSSGVVWRFRTLEAFREECPRGDERLQRVIVEQLDDALDWLESLGAPVVARATGNPRTIGRRFDTRGLTDALLRAAGDVRLETPLPPDAQLPVILTTGGFGGRLARELGIPLRANPWSEGDGLDFARARGAAITGGMDEFYGRVMPLPVFWGEDDFVQYAQVYSWYAFVIGEDGEVSVRHRDDWSENRLVQEIAREGGTATFVVPKEHLSESTPYGTVAEVIDRTRRRGGDVDDRGDVIAVGVTATVTHTIGGIRIDEQARVLDEGGAPVHGLYAAGVDAGGVSTDGYSSGLATALVFGRIAAETAAEDNE